MADFDAFTVGVLIEKALYTAVLHRSEACQLNHLYNAMKAPIKTWTPTKYPRLFRHKFRHLLCAGRIGWQGRDFQKSQNAGAAQPPTVEMPAISAASRWRLRNWAVSCAITGRVENQCRHLLHVTCHEDHCQARDKSAARKLTLRRDFSAKVLRSSQCKRPPQPAHALSSGPRFQDRRHESHFPRFGGASAATRAGRRFYRLKFADVRLIGVSRHETLL